MNKVNIRQLTGRVWRGDSGVILIIRVGDKYYPATEQNASLFESYLRDGNEQVLENLSHELEV